KEAPGGTDDIVEFAFIPAGSAVWSEWTAFPLIREVSGNDVDYFITFFIPYLSGVTDWPTGWSFDAGKTDSRYWAGSSPHSYYLSNGDYTTSDLIEAAGTPVWSGVYTNWTDPNDIYVSSKIDTWRTTGTVESQVFDTALNAPAYNQIKWSEVIPSGTDVVLKARSSASSTMSGATVWDSITGTSTNPNTLSIGSGRYVQFLAELTAEPFWETPKPSSLSYYNYINDQTTPPNPDYEFPVDSDGEPYVTGVYSAWVDDVEIDWPGDERICTIAGYVAKKNSYGQAKITVDGDELSKVLSMHIKVSKEMHGKTVEEENYVDMEPRNTGR
ncbi:MAG: hypothetical protein U9R44_00580, partial [Candidatus Omnitrophota bacterium]|nr:hypothetical protein [Candidatus Omnitrophota bacterium]